MSLKIGGRFLQRTDVKLTGLYVLTFFLSSLIICGFLYFRLKHQLIKGVDRFLIDEINELSEVLSKDMKEKESLKSFEFGVASRTYYPLYFRILDAEGAIFYASEGMRGIEYKVDEKVMSLARKGRNNIEKIHSPGRRRPFRFISAPLYRDGKLAYIVQLGTHLRFIRKSLSGFKRNILAAFPIVLVLGSLGGWLLARRSLSPIGYITSKARSITSANLSERLKLRGADDEMDDLIRTINEMVARLESSFKRMAEFTADASHELKTPICAMRGETEVLLSKGRKAEEYQEGLAHFIEQFDHLNQMINDLILLSKFDATQVELKRVPLRLDLLIKDLCNLFQILAEQKENSLEMGTIEEVTVLGDKVRLQQLFTNLIDNAIKYTSKGSIRVTLQKNEDTALLRVKDTGIGIPREEQEKIFKRFYRVDKSRSRETGGVGLGLSIAEWIAHAHQGKIEVDSELNQGSTFTVHLPIHNV
jgi:heavy metal sensor kinase